jgi:hypothetical protein
MRAKIDQMVYVSLRKHKQDKLSKGHPRTQVCDALARDRDSGLISLLDAKKSDGTPQNR